MFSLKQHLADADLPPFEFEDANGEPRSLPHLKTFSTRQGLRIFVHGELEDVLREEAPDLADELMDLPADAMDALTAEWMKHSGIDLGKRNSSSGSSGSSGGRSRQTSRSGGSGRKSRR